MSADVRVFLGIVFGLPWVLWVFEQVTGVRILFFAAMLSVAIATWVAARYVWRPANIAEATALVPVHPIRRTAGYCLLAFVLFIAMSALAVGFNAVTGLYPADLDGFSALRDVYGPATAGQAGVPWELIGQAFAANLAQFALILPLAFCEEWGWRGYLLNRLRERMGTWPALVLIGVICGVWHLPFYVGPWFSMSGDALRSLLPFTIFCVFFGMVLGWLRLAAGSIWPAVVGHAVNNTVVFGFVQVVVADKAAEPRIDGWLTGLSGWQGWLIMLIPVAVLAARTRTSREVTQGPGKFVR
ncbi:CPBP family intramembrane glutamic endopeptidase [Amorphoplanes digitatis]|uniref:Membrane protease YdiL (CAAX protease family) n=1 Tax=Actinoplanes digitatis TaxID=1868 RepID=A0A7W7MSK5_9ACTN|nr:CPBP family intramembrane glutamic endopeptidase [Actinoplanes digitatis]MBB4764644.1 membrane protease YdiL (CAAX protease family) [Actinoplanes digitatis]GID91405.1 abortive infection protein [Actinoplanes digitatis]